MRMHIMSYYLSSDHGPWTSITKCGPYEKSGLCIKLKVKVTGEMTFEKIDTSTTYIRDLFSCVKWAWFATIFPRVLPLYLLNSSLVNLPCSRPCLGKYCADRKSL